MHAPTYTTDDWDCCSRHGCALLLLFMLLLAPHHLVQQLMPLRGTWGTSCPSPLLLLLPTTMTVVTTQPRKLRKDLRRSKQSRLKYRVSWSSQGGSSQVCSAAHRTVASRLTQASQGSPRAPVASRSQTYFLHDRINAVELIEQYLNAELIVCSTTLIWSKRCPNAD